MILGVMSDSHGNMRQVKYALRAMGDVDLILHAGDFYDDGVRLSAVAPVRVVAVVGNCDMRADGPLEEVLEAGGKRILLTHGHRYGVKYGLQSLAERARVLQADVVVFGHTHIAHVSTEDGILFLNPGSCFRPRDGRPPSYATLEITSDGALVPVVNPL